MSSKMTFPVPPANKTAVNKASKRVSKKISIKGDEELIQQWRDAHAYALNTFQINIKNSIKKINKKILFVQRLKRLSTIVNKLQTNRSSFPMNDIAGSRLIFESVEDIYAFRSLFHHNKAKHKLISLNNDSDHKYDYIKRPKDTGYRGIHDVYAYVPSAESTEAYKDLRIEVQYRTLLQHAWATAVETSDAIDKTRVKFANPDDKDDRYELFRVASEIIARKENHTGCLPSLSHNELLQKFFELESSVKVISRLRSLAKEENKIKGKHAVLSFRTTLSVETFRSAKLAMEHRNKLEIDYPDLDVVYVRLSDPSILDTAFRNYYRDARAFVEIMPIE